MNTPSRWKLAVGLAAARWLAGCSDRGADTPPPAPAPAAPTPPPAPATDQWIGEWSGPEGTFVRITGGNGHYDVTVQNLDGPRTFVGMAVGDAVEFERDGKKEVLRASNGEQTGMKWLAGKKDCLKVRTGEGYCRD
ncbi:hypothetical protein [Hydrogenophaga borbori]|uniref:hypothetical protein n=1 Tax=Hydrogenophaga borbori TaxID=2294117 RepID=UPI00301DBA47